MMYPQLTISESAFHRYVAELLTTSFPDGLTHEVSAAVEHALDRTARCFSQVVLGGYRKNGAPFLNHLHADQMAVFLYFASNSAYEMLADVNLAAKFMLLNKARNGIVITYDTKLPECVLLIHTVGTVLGKATYGNRFVATQNVTVGTHRGNAPTFDQDVILYPGTFVAGHTRVGKGSKIAAGAVVLDTDIPPNSIITGSFPNLTLRESKTDSISQYFDPATAS